MIKKKMKLILKSIVKKLLTPIILLLNNKNFYRFIEIYNPEQLNKLSKNIVTFKIRDKYNFIKASRYTIDIKFNEDFGILLQGPLKKEDRFTYHTLLNYINVVSPERIVVSTWNDEDSDYINKIKQLGVKVILNNKPQKPGFGNINYQIKSTITGLEYFKEIGIQYVAKTRTDTRIEKANAYEFLTSLLKTFKLNEKIQNQKHRIILLDFNTRLTRPFNMSDIFQFGNIDDLINVWKIEEDERENDFDITIKYTEVELFNLQVAENYIMRKYSNKIGISYEYKFESYYKLLAERFIVIDSSQIGHYWYKYFNIEQPQPNENWCASFSDWLILHSKYDPD